MLFHCLGVVISILLPFVLLIAWITAERRTAHTSVRLTLGIACLAVAAIGIASVRYTCDARLSEYHVCLGRAEALLQDGRSKELQNALRIYDETYSETGSYRAALYAFERALKQAREEEPIDRP